MLNPISEGVFEVVADLALGAGFHLPARCTVLRQSDGSLAVISPVPFTEETAASIDEIGRVTHIIAPNKLHHMSLEATSKRWPDARVLGAPGLAEKAKHLRIDEVLGDREDAVGPEFTAVRVQGAPFIEEVVFLHQPSRTLVVTDLLFNMRDSQGFVTNTVLHLMGTHGRLAFCRSFRLATRDRAAAASSVRRILQLDFDRLLMAHGEVVESGAKEQVRTALSWLQPPR